MTITVAKGNTRQVLTRITEIIALLPRPSQYMLV